MTFFTIKQLTAAALPLRSFIRYSGPDGNYTAIILNPFILEVKKNGRYMRTKNSYETLESWVATLPEGASEQLTFQTSQDYLCCRKTMVLPPSLAQVKAKVMANEIIYLIKQQKPSDVELLTEILNKLHAGNV